MFHCLILLGILVPPIIFINSLDIGLERSARMITISAGLEPFYIVNILYLVPTFLKKRKYLRYLLGLFAIILLYYITFRVMNPMGNPLVTFMVDGTRAIEMPQNAFPPFPPFLPFFFLVLSVGTGFELLMDWEKRGKLIEKAEKEKLSAELSFLKTQINPHFFFNTLNSIYALAATDSYNTQRAVLLLSNLMRYVLYESNVDRIALSKEIQFLNDFIDLQKLRFSKENGRVVQMEQVGDISEFKIEPLLLVPFVENAFKHSHSYSKKGLINVHIEAEKDKKLIFSISNSIGEHTDQLEKNSGIGLENAKRRLELLYPDRHRLNIGKSDCLFQVELELIK